MLVARRRTRADRQSGDGTLVVHTFAFHPQSANSRTTHGANCSRLAGVKRGDWAVEPALLNDAATHGVVRSATLVRLGVAASTVSTRCRAGGSWQRLLPGIVLLHNGCPSSIERSAAALLYGGRHAVLSGSAAVGMHGLPTSTNDVLVLVPAAVRRTSSGFAVLQRTTRMPDPVIRSGLRCAPIDRSVIDAARGAQSIGQCRALLAACVQRRLTSVDELAIELAAGQMRHSAHARAVLEELGDGAHSVAEVNAHKIYRRARLPAMLFNCDLVDECGTFVARPDGWLDQVGLAWEIDSLAHHLSPKDHEATMLRRAMLQRYGVVVVSHLPRTLDRAPETVIADLRAGYRLACSRPRPTLYPAHTDRLPTRGAATNGAIRAGG